MCPERQQKGANAGRKNHKSSKKRPKGAQSVIGKTHGIQEGEKDGGVINGSEKLFRQGVEVIGVYPKEPQLRV